MIKVLKLIEEIDSAPIGMKFIYIDYADSPHDFYHQRICKTTKWGDKWIENSEGKIRFI